jgi:hypothetical protein
MRTILSDQRIRIKPYPTTYQVIEVVICEDRVLITFKNLAQHWYRRSEVEIL